MGYATLVSILLSALLMIPAELSMAQVPKTRAVNPDDASRAMWRSIKKQLTAQNGNEYFLNILQNADMPMLIGTLLSATPYEQPNTLIVSLSDGSTPEATLRFTDEGGRYSHLNGPLVRGSQIRFEGIPVAFIQEPFMLTFEVSTSPKMYHAPIPKIAPDHP